jgi:hypothetical protein
LAFTAEVAGLDGDVTVGLVITAGLEALALGTFGGMLLSLDLHPVVTNNSPKIKIPKMLK